MIQSPVVPDEHAVERSLAIGAARWGTGVFLALHGWLHWGIASAAQRPGAFRVPSLWGPSYPSPVLEQIGLGGASQVVGGLLWMAAAIGFVAAAASLMRLVVPAGWARDLVIGSSACSLLLFWLFWTDPVLIGAVISGILGAAALAWPLAVRAVRALIARRPEPHHA